MSFLVYRDVLNNKSSVINKLINDNEAFKHYCMNIYNLLEKNKSENVKFSYLYKNENEVNSTFVINKKDNIIQSGWFYNTSNTKTIPIYEISLLPINKELSDHLNKSDDNLSDLIRLNNTLDNTLLDNTLLDNTLNNTSNITTPTTITYRYNDHDDCDIIFDTESEGECSGFDVSEGLVENLSTNDNEIINDYKIDLTLRPQTPITEMKTQLNNLMVNYYSTQFSYKSPICNFYDYSTNMTQIYNIKQSVPISPFINKVNNALHTDPWDFNQVNFMDELKKRIQKTNL